MLRPFVNPLSETLARIPMVLCGVITVAIMAALARRWLGQWAGIAALWLFALNPFLIWFSRLSTMYGVMLLGVAGSFWAFGLLLNRRRPLYFFLLGALHLHRHLHSPLRLRRAARPIHLHLAQLQTSSQINCAVGNHPHHRRYPVGDLVVVERRGAEGEQRRLSRASCANAVRRVEDIVEFQSGLHRRIFDLDRSLTVSIFLAFITGMRSAARQRSNQGWLILLWCMLPLGGGVCFILSPQNVCGSLHLGGGVGLSVVGRRRSDSLWALA